MEARLISLQVGGVQDYPESPTGKAWQTGFVKHPMEGSVFVGRTNLTGDEQADLVNHGGPDKAICAYPADHYPAWRNVPGLEQIRFGGFGENFSLAGIGEDAACLGDVWSIGEVVVEVSQPRQPCWKLARRWRIKDLPLQVVQSGRTGWYFRVREEGTITAGGSLKLEDRPFPDWTIARANHIYHHDKQNSDAAMELVEVPALAESWRKPLLNRIRKLSSH